MCSWLLFAKDTLCEISIRYRAETVLAVQSAFTLVEVLVTLPSDPDHDTHRDDL